MISIDITHLRGYITSQDLCYFVPQLHYAHQMLAEGIGPGGDYTGWLTLPSSITSQEILKIQRIATRLQIQSDVVVIVGIGGSYLGARAAIEMLCGSNHNLTQKPQIVFAGTTLSTYAWNELTTMLQDKNWSMVIISKSGTTTEPAIATRTLRQLMAEKYSPVKMKEHIVVITDPHDGALRAMAHNEGWATFEIPPSVGGRYSVLSAVGLLPMAIAGIDINKVIQEAQYAQKVYDVRGMENAAWQYAALRNALYNKDKLLEILVTFDPCLGSLGKWWQQLFGESEGKDAKGLFPVTAEFPADLHSLGQMIQQGKRNMFETMLRFSQPKIALIPHDAKNLDNLNYLAQKTLAEIDQQSFFGTVDAHEAGGVPVAIINAGVMDEAKLGELLYFFELSCALSAHLLGVNPFSQPGVEYYKQNMFKRLGKPGY